MKRLYGLSTLRFYKVLQRNEFGGEEREVSHTARTGAGEEGHHHECVGSQVKCLGRKNGSYSTIKNFDQRKLDYKKVISRIEKY